MAYASTPAARSLRGSCLLKVSKSVFSRCAPLPIVHTISTLAGSGVYLLSRGGAKDESGWMTAALVMGMLTPYTIALIAPINSKILDGEVADDDAHPLMETWSKYHSFRTLVASGVFLYYTYKIATK